MKLKTSILTVISGLALFASPANAASILWVQNNDGIEAAWSTLMTSNGHTLTAFTGNRALPNQADIDFVNSFDLIVITRSAFNQSPTSGGGLLRDNGPVWNLQVTTPIIMMQSFLPAGHFSSNWDWTTTRAGGVQPTTVNGTLPMTVNDPTDPIWAGVSFGEGNTLPTALHTNNIQTIDRPVLPGAVVVASSPVNNNPLIVRYPAGISIAGGNLAGERMIFAMNSGNDSQNLTLLGEQVFLNAVDNMAIPEPSSAALLALAGLALLRRRRG